MKPKVFVTNILADEIITRLEEEFEVVINKTGKQLSHMEILNGVKNTDFLFCQLADKIDEEIICANPNLKGIINYAVGYNNIDVKTATQNGIYVCNTPGVLTETTADLAWALIFAVARKIVEADKFVRDGKFTGWEATLFMGNDIYNKTLGIVGAGRIGQAIAKRAVGFGMKIVYYNRAEKNVMKQLGAEKVSLEDLLKCSDFISINLPFTDETKYLITEKEFSLMKPNAILINTARGPIVNEKDLVVALQKSIIAGAGLDVYENEPKVEKELLKMDNVVLLPHIGSASYETRIRMGMLCLESIHKIWKGQIPENIVNNEK